MKKLLITRRFIFFFIITNLSLVFAYDTSSSHVAQGKKNQHTPIIALEPAGPKVSNGADVFVSLDYLFWNVNAGSQLSAVEINSSSPAPTLPRQRSFSLFDHWTSGFKVALGLNISYDDWFTLTEYTWLRPSQSQKATAYASYSFKAPIWTFLSNNNASQPGGVFEEDSHLNFNVIDWKIGRNAYFGKHLTLAPHLGLKGTWQTFQNNQSLQNTQAINFNPLTFTGPIRQFYKNTHHGIGILTGIKLNLFLTPALYIESQLECTGMWSKNAIDIQIAADDDPTPLKWKFADYKRTHYPIDFIADFLLGLGYLKYFSHDNYCLSISTGWVCQTWIDWIPTTILSNANLNLQGLDLKVRFDF